MKGTNGFILGMLAETSIHPGTGESHNVINLPIARESTTSYPMIPGSSLKGALRNKGEQQFSESVEPIFGTKSELGNANTEAGQVGFSDVRLLLLPVRSLTGQYRWLTCQYLLERFNRDRQFLGLPQISYPDKEIKMGEAWVNEGTGTIFLEEFSYTCKEKKDVLLMVLMQLKQLIAHNSVADRLEGQLVILHDDDFAHFARYGLPVRARNHLDAQTKESKNLWHEETLPADTVMYSLIMARPGHEPICKKLQSQLQKSPYVQVGGNETLGQGWFITSIV